jgi:ankyrin repeat protein
VIAAVLGFVVLSALISAIWQRVRKPEEGTAAGHPDDATPFWDTWKEVSGWAVGCLMLGALLFCALSGGVSAVWLMIKGEWWLLVGGTLAMVAMPLVYPLVMLPTLPFGYGTLYFSITRQTWAAAIAVLAGCVYQAFVATIWAAGVFFVVVANAHAGTEIPAIIWGFNVAVAPLAHMMGRRQAPSDSSWIGVMLAALAYWAVALLHWLEVSPSSIGWAVLALTVLGTALTLLNLFAYVPQTKPIRPDRTEPARWVRSTEPWSVLGNLLHSAARRGDVAEVRRLLLEHGAEVDVRDNEGETALHCAATNGHHKVVALLLEHGAEVDAEGYPGLTPLDLAATNGHYKAGALLLKRGARVNARTEGSLTPLDLAAINGHCRVASLLLKRGADVNAGDKDGLLTPLHLAAKNGQCRMGALLLKRGAEVNAGNKDGRATPLDLASTSAVAALLVRRGAELNARNEGDWTPLHSAASEARCEVVALLLQRGADVNASSGFGTPLHCAAMSVESAPLSEHRMETSWGAGRKAQREVVELLLERGAEVDAQDNQGKTALCHAIRDGHREMVELLLVHGADPTAINGRALLKLVSMMGWDTSR